MVYKVVQQSTVLKPSATLGVVNAGLKVSICRLGSEHFLTASVGSSFHIYDCDDLQLQYLSRPLRGPISAVLSVGEFTIVSVGAELLIFHKMVVLATLEGHTSPVEQMSSIGDSLLVSVGGAEVFVWQLPKLSKKWSGEKNDLISLKPLRELKVGFAVSALISVPTYVNKILLGGSSGELELWNVNRGEKLYSFLLNKSSGSAITAFAAAPALDIVGVGYADGTISVMNLKLDECVISLKQSEHGSVTSLSFRQDSVGGQLVSGTDKGDIVVWDLNKRVIFSFLKCAHPGGVGSMQFLDTLPIMVTSGVSDNAISVYSFDKPDGGCRLLKERRGFTSDFCSLIPYGPHDLIVGSSSGEVGKLNLIQSQQNKVWSQAKALQSATSGKNSLMPWKFRNFQNNHLPEVTSISSCEGKLRHFDWPNVATTHKGVAEGYMWSAHQQALVTRMLIVPRKPSTGQRPPCAVSVAVSSCGNYAALGLDNGEVHRFNVQSCYHRGLVAGSSKSGKSVVGMHFISSRDLIIAWADSSVEIWKIVPRPELVRAITCAGPPGIRGFNVNGFLCAVWHDSGSVLIADIHADKIVRKVNIGSAAVSATAWSEGGKWLAIATEDKRMVIYDLPTASIVDRIEFSCSVKSMVFAHNNAQLVTAHQDGRGAVRVWQNLSLLGDSSAGARREEIFIPIDGEAENFFEINLEDEKVPQKELGGKEDDGNNFMRLWEGSSRTRWQQILRLDEIKERNRPLKPAEKPKSAPFFLPVKYQGVEPVFAPSGPSLGEDDDTLVPEVKRQRTEDGYLEMVAKGEFEKLKKHLVSLTPSGVHICISELESQVYLDNFVAFLANELEAGNNLDLVASWTALFVNMHSASLIGSALGKLETAAKKISLKFDQETNEIECLLKVTAALQLHR